MKKFAPLLVLMTLALASEPASASIFKRAKLPASTTLQKVTDALRGFSTDHLAVYQIVRSNAPRGRKPEQIRVDTIKEAMSRFICKGSDEEIRLDRATGKDSAVDQILSDLGIDRNIESGGPNRGRLNALESALRPALSERTIEIYSGQASGPESSGDILGIYDMLNDEVIAFSIGDCSA